MVSASEDVPEGYKQTEIGVIPEDWVFSNWGDFIERCIGGSTPSRAIPSFFKGEIPWITSTELNYNFINDTVEKITSDAVTSANLTMLPIGTFLMAITGLEAEGTRGSCAITNIRATTNQSCMAIIPKSTLDTLYLCNFYLLKWRRFYALKYCQGSNSKATPQH